MTDYTTNRPAFGPRGTAIVLLASVVVPLVVAATLAAPLYVGAAGVGGGLGYATALLRRRFGRAHDGHVVPPSLPIDRFVD